MAKAGTELSTGNRRTACCSINRYSNISTTVSDRVKERKSGASGGGNSSAGRFNADTGRERTLTNNKATLEGK